jgi:hypothetical protein
MSKVVCLMNVEAERATFTWSEGPASFEPYTLDGMVYQDFKEIAAAAREKLANLVKDYLFDEQAVPKSAFALAEAGHELYQAMFQPGAEQARQARQVRKWLEKLAQQQEVDTLEVVVESPWSLSWNIIYDQEPDKAAFLSGDDNPDRWKPFWGLRYNLAGGRKVDPLRRMPLLNDPKVLLVVDRDIRIGLPEEQQKRLADFAERHELKLVDNKDELQNAVKAQRPDLLYWLSHASADALLLAGEPISPRNMRKLLQQDDDENFGGLAFLNACQTAEGGESGSFFEAFHSVGFAGMIGTEHQTIDQFANPLGLDFLEAFLDRGEPVGSALRKLRGRVPLGLLYGTYCPPDIRVNRGNIRENLDIQQTYVQGVALGAAVAPDSATRTLPPLPDEPYPSLAYYERKDRALFAGRDDDVERFATMLDDASTRILVLHGESGVGKSSFLHAGVIPYLEEECLGYRFIRDRQADESVSAQGSVIFVRATNDLFGQLAQALCEFCARPYEYQTPLGETVSADLPGVLAEFAGNAVSQAAVRSLLRADPAALGQLLTAISSRLPFTAILVIDQGEEVFTLAQTAEDQQRGRQALDMLRRTVGTSGDFKAIFALRTEYYGRVIDRLRRGLHDTGSIREYLLTDFDEQSLVEAIRRPTSAEPIPYAAEVPFEKYGFGYGQGVAEEVAKRVVRYTAQRRDSVLPLMQVICSQLYRLARRRADKTIALADLEALGGIEGGMRNHVGTLLADLLKGRPLDRRPVHTLFTQLYLKQADGTLTTALLAEDEVRNRWTGRMPFDELLESCRKLRLLKVNSLRIGMEEERRYVSLGHDALARIAADWDDALSRRVRIQKWVYAFSTACAGAALLAFLALSAWAAKTRAESAEKVAKQITQELAGLYLQPIVGVGDIAAANTPLESRESFSRWKTDYYNPDQGRITSAEIEIAVKNLEQLFETSDDDLSRDAIGQASLGVARAVSTTMRSRPRNRDTKTAVKQHELETEIFLKPLCDRATAVTQEIANASSESGAKVLVHRAEFERLYWAELYLVELAEKQARSTHDSPLESAMIRFRCNGLQNWGLKTLHEDGRLDAKSTERLRQLAADVRLRCHAALEVILRQE